jgi:hypothetical protein
VLFLAKITPYVVYGCATWIVFVVAYTGRVCSATYSLASGVTWLLIYTLLGFTYWIPIVAVVAGLAYVAATKTPLARTPRLRRSVATAVLAAIFVITAIAAPPNHECVAT